MKPKYLFFDVDGTLLPFGKGLPDGTKEALLRAKELGHRIFLSTGRSYSELDPRLEVIPFDGGIYAGGARVIADGKDIFASYLSRECLEWTYALGREQGWGYLLQTDEATFLSKEMNKQLMALFMESLGRPLVISGVTVVDELPYREDATKLVFITSHHDAKESASLVSKYFDLFENTMGVSKSDCAELSQKGITKATGLEKILEYYGASIEESIAFGDGANDVDIIKAAGIGVSMGNGSKELKQAADYITADVDDDGIRKALLELGVI